MLERIWYIRISLKNKRVENLYSQYEKVKELNNRFPGNGIFEEENDSI